MRGHVHPGFPRRDHEGLWEYSSYQYQKYIIDPGPCGALDI